VDLEVLVVLAQWRWTFVVEEGGVGRLVGKCGTKRPADDCKWEEWGMDLPRSGCVGRHARWACMGRTPPPPNGPGRRTPLPAASHQALHASRAYWHLLRCHGVPVPLDAHKQCPAISRFWLILLSSQFWPMLSMSRGVINCAKLFLSHRFSRIKSFDQWAVDRDPFLTSTTSAKIGKTAIIPSCAGSHDLTNTA